MSSLRTFKDDFGLVRKNGEEWLIKMSDTETHIPNVYEEVDANSLIIAEEIHYNHDNNIQKRFNTWLFFHLIFRFFLIHNTCVVNQC